MRISPTDIAAYARAGMVAEAEGADAMDCIECGSCSYTCPSSRPLLDYIRLGKAEVGKLIRARKSV